ncbi:histidine phosphatase family protein [Stenotrophomonas sp. Ker107b]
MLTLIRHAQSTANAGSATHDPATIPLTPAGHLHAKQLARSAFPSPVGAVWSSPYLRAVQTATPTAERYGLTVQELPIHEFTYLCPARCAGTTASERMQWVEDYWSRCDPKYIDGPGAESFSMLVGRARDALCLLGAGMSAGHTLAFSHGQLLQMIYWLHVYKGDPVSKTGMRGYRALDRQMPIRHCEGLSIYPTSSTVAATVSRWPSRSNARSG